MELTVPKFGVTGIVAANLARICVTFSANSHSVTRVVVIPWRSLVVQRLGCGFADRWCGVGGSF